MEIEKIMQRSFMPGLALEVLKDAEESYRTHRTFTEDTLLSLNSMYGYVLTKAVEIVDKNGGVCEYKVASDLRRIFVVCDNDECFYVRDGINWCRCDAFRQFVLGSRTRLTCKHVLAVEIGKITQRHNVTVVTDENMIELLNHGHE